MNIKEEWITGVASKEEVTEERINEACDKLREVKQQLAILNAKVRGIQKQKQEIEFEVQNLISWLPEKKYTYKDREYSVGESIRVTRTVNFDQLWNNHPDIYNEFVAETRKYTEKLYDKKAKKVGGE